MRRHEDELFAAFQRTGDPETLGEVYDLVAPELLRVALHLTGGPAEAEDVLQSTFVAAIERADAYDATRPLRPWLLGILANQAKLANRRRHREPDPDRLHERRSTEPLEAVWNEELDERVQRALEALSPAYQPVLVLHLRHGLSAAEIATALGRPPGTVRSQLTRGLERLRDALPASLAGTALALLGRPARGEAAVREAVVAHASSVLKPAAAVAAAWIPGALLMKSLAIAAGLAGIVVAGWTLRSPERHTQEVVRPTEPVEPARAVLEPAPQSERGAVRVADAPTDSAATPGPAPAAARAADTGDLVVRASWDADGSPVEDAVVLARVFSDAPYLDERVARTDESGVATFRGLPPGHTYVRLLRGDEGQATVRAGDTATLELGLPAGMTVEGIVVDEHDRGVPGAHVWLSERWRSDAGYATCRADEAGRFRLRGLRSDHYVGAFAPGRARSYLQPLRGIEGETLPVRIVLREEGTDLRGVVVDPEGTPVEGALVQLGRDQWKDPVLLADGLAAPGPPPCRTRTDADGEFVLASVAAGPHTLSARAPGFGTTTTVHDVARGAAGPVRVTLVPQARVRGRVVDAAGTPLRAAWVHTQPAEDFAASSAHTDGDGRFELSGLPEGFLQVEAELPGAGSVSAEVLVVAGRTTEWNPVLAPAPRIFGRLVDADGEPVERWHVVAVDHGRRERMRSSSSDPMGRFSIDELEDAEYTLWAQPPGAWRDFPAVIVEGVRPGLDPVTIDVDDGAAERATIVVRVLDPAGEPAAAELTVWHHEKRIWRTFVTREGTGEVRVQDVPAGTVRLELRSREHPWVPLGERELAAGATLDVGTIRFEPSGTVSGTVAGVPEDALGTLRISIANARHAGAGTVSVDGRTFRSSPLAPGAYTLLVSADLVVSERVPFEIRVGEDRRLDPSLRPAGTRRVVFEPSDPALPTGTLWCSALDGANRQLWIEGNVRRNAAGQLEARVSLEPGTYRLVGETDTGLAVRAELVIRDFGYDDDPVRVALAPKGG